MVEAGLFLAGAVVGYVIAMYSAKLALAKALKSDVVYFDGSAYQITLLSGKRGAK